MFYVSLLKKNIIKKRQINKKVKNFDFGNSIKYKIR